MEGNNEIITNTKIMIVTKTILASADAENQIVDSESSKRFVAQLYFAPSLSMIKRLKKNTKIFIHNVCKKFTTGYNINSL